MTRLQQRLLAESRPSVARYAAELPQWLPATVHFSTTSTRYLELPGAVPNTIDPPTITVTDTPALWDSNNLTPPAYPDIAWWWKQLDNCSDR